MVCDPAPPAPIPPVPATEPAHSAWERQLLGLYGDEVVKWLVGSDCRMRVRAANAQAADEAK